MLKRSLSLILLIFFHICTLAQYATTGTGNLRNEIWWFDWAGFTVTNGASRTFTTNDGMVVTITFSQVSPDAPTPRVMNTWQGAVLHFLYNFTDPAVQPALYQYTFTAGTTSSFTMRITATRAGIPTAFTFVAADAEAGSINEIIRLQTDGSNWQATDFFRNSSQTTNPLTGCNTQTVAISETYGGSSATGQNPVISTNSASGTLTINTTFDHFERGGIAVAFGILAPVDRGDLPASYGVAHHRQMYTPVNGCNYLPPLPTVRKDQSLYIGAVPPDADGQESTDDNTNGMDEENTSTYPLYTNTGTYSIPVALSNTTGQDAYLTGWFDYNRNGRFDNNESVSVTVPPNTTTATLTWTGLPAFLPTGTATGYGFRLRLSSDAASAQPATGFAQDGEVEDYFIPSAALCQMRVVTINDTTVCAGQPVPLQATGGSQYQWNINTYLSNQNIPNPVATPEQPITYIVTGTNPQGCEAKDTVTIGIKAPPAITISNDATICPGTTTQLSATAPGAVAYTWWPQQGLNNTAISNPAASPSTPTEYVVLVEGSNGCLSKDSVKVAIHPAPQFALAPVNPVICPGDTLLLTASGGDEYTWSAGNTPIPGNTASLQVYPTTTTSYDILIKENTCQRTATLSVPVIVHSLPATTVTSSNSITCSNGQAVLQATGGRSYQWDAQPGITNLTVANPVVSPLQTTTYYVTITNSNGCAARDSITVAVDFTQQLNQYAMPSAFTPNNDNNNDCFGLKYWGRVTSLQFEVFNRWGERVFHTSNPAQCWNGTYKGVLQPGGGYMYQVKATTTCGTVYRKGIVMLIR